MSRIVPVLFAVLAIILIAGGVIYSRSVIHTTYLPAGTGITAQRVCSLTTVSGFTAEEARDLYIDVQLGWAADFIPHRVDAETGAVSASLLGLGLYERTAIPRDGLGCTLVFDEESFDAALTAPRTDRRAAAVDGAHAAAHFDRAALNSALDKAFAEPDAEGGRNTLAVVVMHQGRLVAERYADGVEADTKLHGWSMSKSVAAALAGRLAHLGLFDPDAAGVLSEKIVAEDPRKGAITTAHLLSMTAGLSSFEDYGGMDPNSRMMFSEPDGAAFVEHTDLHAEPGAAYSYQTGQTRLAARAMQAAIPGDLLRDVAFIHKELFAPIGFDAVFEPDQSGVLAMGSFGFATARSWARLGQLYLDDGVAPDGTRLLSSQWVKRAGQAGPREDYGLGFWKYFPDNGFPEGTIGMNGHQRQYVFIIPEADLVVARLGATHYGVSSGAGTLARDVMAAMTAPPVIRDDTAAP